jgi:GT2 family glycosyltransferase
MSFAVAIPTVTSVDTIDEAVISVLNQDVEAELLIIQNGSPVSEKCDAWEKKGIEIYRPDFNLGCSASWNYACRWAFQNGHDKIFLMNDDFELLDTDIFSKINQAYIDNPNAHYHLWGFSAVSISKDLFEKVGPFDEGFWPAYFEDNDYYQRSLRVGVEWIGIQDINVVHNGSSSVRSSVALTLINETTFTLNKQRYIAKWGGEPHFEKFEQPWDGNEPTFLNVRDLLKNKGWNHFNV